MVLQIPDVAYQDRFVLRDLNYLSVQTSELLHVRHFLVDEHKEHIDLQQLKSTCELDQSCDLDMFH